PKNLKILGGLRVLMTPVVEPDGLMGALKVLDLISPVQAGADQPVAENERLAFAFGAVKKLGSVKSLDISVSYGRSIRRAQALRDALFARTGRTRLARRLGRHSASAYTFRDRVNASRVTLGSAALSGLL